MKLVIFDVDGTLTNTYNVDAECYTEAIATTLAMNAADIVWENCPHITDSGITQHLFFTRYDRDPDAAEIDAIRQRFVALLQSHYERDASLFDAMPGATEMLAHLQQHADWAIAIATGGWQKSARFKLSAAGFTIDGIPIATADDAPARETILQTAMARAVKHYGCEAFDKIVSVGDGLWDVRTARTLQLDFLGIAAGERAARLRQAGAQHILTDFRDYDLFFQRLNDAVIPDEAACAG